MKSCDEDRRAEFVSRAMSALFDSFKSDMSSFWNDLSINASVKNIANEPTGLCKVRWNRKRSVINKVPRK